MKITITIDYSQGGPEDGDWRRFESELAAELEQIAESRSIPFECNIEKRLLRVRRWENMKSQSLSWLSERCEERLPEQFVAQKLLQLAVLVLESL